MSQSVYTDSHMAFDAGVPVMNIHMQIYLFLCIFMKGFFVLQWKCNILINYFNGNRSGLFDLLMWTLKMYVLLLLFTIY
jgi:hypothetical protein